MSIFDKYKTSISEITPKGKEQEECYRKLKTFINWEEVVNTEKLYRQYNPSNMDPVPFMYDYEPENAKYKRMWLEAEQKMTGIMKSEPWSFTILGTVGNGKTTLSCGLINELKIRSSLRCEYTTQWELIDSYKKNFDEAIYKKCCKADLLVIDELTTLNLTDFGKGFIQSILNSRYTNTRKTILIGNINPKEFKDFFEPHIISRLREGMSMVMTAPDMREKGDF